MPGSQTSRTIRSNGAARDALEARLAARHRLDAVAFVAQHAARARSGRRVRRRRSGSWASLRQLRCDRSDECFARASLARRSAAQHGNSIVNRVPRGVLSPTSMLPPCSAMIRRTIARPEAAAAPLGRVVRQEQLVALRRRNARAVVGDDDTHDAVRRIELRLDDDLGRGVPSLRSALSTRLMMTRRICSGVEPHERHARREPLLDAARR